ncbi:hypothetical protein JCM5296_005735 [Sporobolomyces johnsonii]
MYIPPADYIGYAFEGAARYLAKRSDDEEAFKLTHTQWVTVYCAELYVILLLLSWNLYIARSIIFPFKLTAVACHEGCHALVGTLTGAKVKSIMLDPNQGGATAMEGGLPFLSLPAGYIGSSTIGAALIFASFDQKASKIAVIPFVCVLLVVCAWARKSRFTVLNVSFTLGLCVIFLLVEHAAYLRFLLLFIGCMNVMYSVWDEFDDLVLHKINESDVCAFQRLYPWLPAQVWGAIWFLVSCCSLTAAILGGIVCFKKDFAEQYLESQTFMPT